MLIILTYRSNINFPFRWVLLGKLKYINSNVEDKSRKEISAKMQSNQRKCLLAKRVFTELLVTPFTPHFSLIGILFYAKCQPNYYSWSFNNQYLNEKIVKSRLEFITLYPVVMILGVAKMVTILRFHNGEREFLLELLLGSLYFRFYVLKMFFIMKKSEVYNETILRCIMTLFRSTDRQL